MKKSVCVLWLAVAVIAAICLTAAPALQAGDEETTEATSKAAAYCSGDLENPAGPVAQCFGRGAEHTGSVSPVQRVASSDLGQRPSAWPRCR